MNNKENLITDQEESQNQKNDNEVFKKSGSKKENRSKKEKIKELEQQISELKDKNLRLLAEFDNFRKRNAKERLELIQTAGKEVLMDLLPLIDDFERALDNHDKVDDIKAVKKGVALIHTKFVNFLMNRGLTAMDSIGEDFDSEKHEAISEVAANSDNMKGKVMDVVEKGYYLNDKIIRFAKVVVGK